MEGLAQLLNMEIISPLSRIDRMSSNQLSSLRLVLGNTNAWGHTANATYWGSSGLGNSDGYISLPLTFVTLFGLPFPLFYGILVTKRRNRLFPTRNLRFWIRFRLCCISSHSSLDSCRNYYWN